MKLRYKLIFNIGLAIFAAIYPLSFSDAKCEISSHHDCHKRSSNNQRQARIRVKRHTDNDEDQIHNNNVIADREPFGLEVMIRHLVAPTLSEAELAERQREPWNHARKNTCTVDVQEQLGVRHQVVQHNPNQQQGDCNDDTVAGTPPLDSFLKKAGACPF